MAAVVTLVVEGALVEMAVAVIPAVEEMTAVENVVAKKEDFLNVVTIHQSQTDINYSI